MSEIDKIREMVYALARGDMEAANSAKAEVFASKARRITQEALESEELEEGAHNPLRRHLRAGARHNDAKKNLHSDMVATESRKDVDDEDEDGVKVRGNRPKPEQTMRRRRPRPSKAYESTETLATESRKSVDDEDEDGVKVKGNRPKPEQSMRRRRPRPSNAYESADKKVDEKWNSDYETPEAEKGKYKGKSLEDLHAMRDRLADKKDKTKAEVGKLRELDFAIRAKTGWGKVDK